MGEIRIVSPGKTCGCPYPICKKICLNTMKTLSVKMPKLAILIRSPNICFNEKNIFFSNIILKTHHNWSTGVLLQSRNLIFISLHRESYTSGNFI